VTRNLSVGSVYEIKIKNLELKYGKSGSIDANDSLSNGRVSYYIFEKLIRELTGLKPGTGGIDHVDSQGRKFEQKSFSDLIDFPTSGKKVHCGPSAFFAKNSGTAAYRAAISQSYKMALKLCDDKGYSKNDFYIFTNTSGFTFNQNFKYFVIPTSTLIANLDKEDPRKILRSTLLQLNQGKSVLLKD